MVAISDQVVARAKKKLALSVRATVREVNCSIERRGLSHGESQDFLYLEIRRSFDQREFSIYCLYVTCLLIIEFTFISVRYIFFITEVSWYTVTLSNSSVMSQVTESYSNLAFETSQVENFFPTFSEPLFKKNIRLQSFPSLIKRFIYFSLSILRK